MKKTLLATAILSAIISTTAGAATVYDNNDTTMEIGGRVEVRGLFNNDDAVETMTDRSRSRINFSGETQISESLAGFGFMEYEIAPGGTVSNRYLYAGFATSAGDFSYGRQDTASVQVSNMTDIASYHSGIQQQYITSASDKENNTFLYSGEFSDALTLKVNYIAQETEDMDALGLSAYYAMGFGLDLAVSYADQDEQNQVTFGASYSMDALYLAATYAVGEMNADTEFTSLEVAIQYKATKQLRLIGLIGMAEVEDTDTEDFFALEAQYRFNKSIRTYASYKINNLDGAENELLVGLRYNF